MLQVHHRELAFAVMFLRNLHPRACDLHCWGVVASYFEQDIAFGQFNALHGTRVGEANHPGPYTATIMISNPTALVGKISEVVRLPHEVMMFSETSATKYEEYSLQGEAGGTCIFSRLPCRQYRGAIPDIVWSTCRFSTAVLQLHCCEVLLICVYGFPDNRTSETKRLNNHILAAAYHLASRQNLPYIVAGDFNTTVTDLPVE